MNRTSPLDVLVETGIEQLRFQEAALARSLQEVSTCGGGGLSHERLLESLADVKCRASRLERMLEAMDTCGYTAGSHRANRSLDRAGSPRLMVI